MSPSAIADKKKLTDTDSKVVTFRLRKPMAEQLKAIAKLHQMGVGELLRYLVAGVVDEKWDVWDQ